MLKARPKQAASGTSAAAARTSLNSPGAASCLRWQLKSILLPQAQQEALDECLAQGLSPCHGLRQAQP